MKRVAATVLLCGVLYVITFLERRSGDGAVGTLRHNAPASKCERLLRNANDTIFSQFGQDAYLLRNHFPNTYGGFYIELGAYHPFKYSNTAYLDICRGWRGLCIDMNPYHKAEFEKDRSCTFIHACVAENKSYVDYYLNDNDLGDGKEGTSRTACMPFHILLSRYNVKHVQLLSIDIEGGEMGALRTFPFSTVPVDTLLIETWRTGKEPIFDHLFRSGFVHTAELGPDDLFVRGPGMPWLPSRHDEWLSAVRKQKEDTVVALQKPAAL
jgi:hypothetical protein